MGMLYGSQSASVTYQEILDLLKDGMPKSPGAKGDFVLLGDHDGLNRRGKTDDSAVADGMIKDVLKRLTEKWPDGASLKTGRGDGRDAFDFLMPAPRPPRAEFLEALKRLLGKAGVLRPEPGSPYAWKRVKCGLETTAVLPNWRDRHAYSREALMDSAPLLYHSEVAVSRPRWRPREFAHVYIDVSGSMSKNLPWLAGALDSLQRQGACRLYAFSTIVAPIIRGRLLNTKISNTFGTDINCVYEHALGLPGSQCPRRAVVITDGMTGKPKNMLVDAWARKQIMLYAGLVGDCDSSDLKGYAVQMEMLPDI